MSDAVNEAKANELVLEAEKKLQPSAWSFFSSKSGKVEAACELYEKAGNFYKLAKNYNKAGEVYAKAAACQIDLGSKYEAASAYVKASQAYRQGRNAAEVEKVLTRAIELFSEEGRFNMAAKNQKDLAELYEQEAQTSQALDSYMKAGEFYEGEGSTSSANQCYLKAAEFAAAAKEYQKAVDYFERVAQASVGNKLLQWSVKDYLLKAGLCRLALGDIVATKKAFDSYISMSDGFAGTREYKLLDDLVNAVEGMDTDAFSSAVSEYDSISRLDAWKTAILLEIKNMLEQEDEVDFT